LSFADYLENYVLDRLFGSESYAQPAQHLALYTVAPNEAGAGGTEVSGSGYARLQVEGGTGRTWSAAAGGSVSNSAEWAFPAASGGAWGTIVAVGIRDAPSGGNLLLVQSLGTPRTVGAGDVFKFASGAFTINLS
jgi:hypothetical protein